MTITLTTTKRRTALETAAVLIERGHFRRLGHGSYLIESATEEGRWYPVVNRSALDGRLNGGVVIVANDYGTRRVFCACEAGWSGQTCGHALYSEWLRNHPHERSK